MSSIHRKSNRAKRKSKPLSRFLRRHSTLLTSVAVFVIGFFVWSMFSEKILDQSLVKAPNSDQSNLTVKNNNDEILELTKRLLAEQQNTEKLTTELHNQSLKLKTLLKKTLNKTNNNDQRYINALSKVGRFKNHSTQSNHTLAQTDYYNKVRISLSSEKAIENQIQQQVNLLIQPKKANKETIYLKTLKKESHVRSNEVRSIVLKKGDTLWALAKRAYGKGDLYPKILKANPQITKKNIKRLQLGTVIRVPL